jgi:hypothetical protein
MPTVSNDSSEFQSQPRDMHGACDNMPQQTVQPGVAAAAMPAVGSAEWTSQLQKIKDVCRKAMVDHTLIDGLLADSVAP